MNATSHEAEGLTTGFPCYKATEIDVCKITDAYLTVLVIMATFCTYKGFKDSIKDESQSRSCTPYNFLKTFASGRKWGSDTTELKDLILTITKRHKFDQDFSDQTRQDIRNVISLLAAQNLD